MQKLLNDAFDLACFRIKPLNHYVYPWWQPVLLLTVLGVVNGVLDADLQADWPLRMLVHTALLWLITLLQTFYFSWWLRQGRRWKGDGSLFPLQVLGSLLSLPVSVLLAWSDPVWLMLLLPPFLVYLLVLQVRSLALACAVPVKHVLVGLLIMLPLAVLMMNVLALLLSAAGLIQLPPAQEGP